MQFSNLNLYPHHNSNATSAVNHKVTIKVPFLSTHAEIVSGSLQTRSCLGSWEHGGYICLALPDICYVTYVNKVRVVAMVTGYWFRDFRFRGGHVMICNVQSYCILTLVFDVARLVNRGISCQRGECKGWHALYSPGK